MTEESGVLPGWRQRLADELAGIDEMFKLLERARVGQTHLSGEQEVGFGLTHDGADVAHQYERIITRLIEALGSLPEFKSGRGLIALQALRLDLHSIDEGNYPERLRPVAREPRLRSNAGKRVYQAHVILCVRLLEELGLSGSAAREHVARLFTQEGHRGPQGGRVSPETLTKWREAVLSEAVYAAGRRLIERELGAWKRSGNWPPSLDDALAFIARKANNPIISLAAST
jgi:hypothetical protein